MLKDNRLYRLLFLTLVVALAAPVAGQADTAGFDSVLSQTESRDPVPEGEVVTYTLSVFNAGPNPANPFSIHVDVSPGAITGAAGTKWLCTFSATAADCAYSGARPALRTANPLVISVTAPTVNDGPIFQSATLSTGGDANPNNNAVSEDTDVSGNGSYSKNIPPSGGSMTTDDGQGATTENPFFGTLTFPAGPGGVARLVEHPERLPECAVLNCVGDTLEVIVPPGYTNPSTPIVILMTYDVSIVQANSTITQVVIKPEEGDNSPDSVPPCSVAGVAFPTPCVDSQTTLANGDVEVKILMISGDPWYQGVEVPVPTS